MKYYIILFLLLSFQIYCMEDYIKEANDTNLVQLLKPEEISQEIMSLKDTILKYLACTLSESDVLNILLTHHSKPLLSTDKALPEELLILLKHNIIKYRSNIAWKNGYYQIECLTLPMIEKDKEQIIDFLNQTTFITKEQNTLRLYKLNSEKIPELLNSYVSPYLIENIKVDTQSQTIQFLNKTYGSNYICIWDLAEDIRTEVKLPVPIYDFKLSPNKKYLFLMSRSHTERFPLYRLYVYALQRKEFVEFGNNPYHELDNGIVIKSMKNLILFASNKQIVTRVPGNNGGNLIQIWNIIHDDYNDLKLKLVNQMVMRSYKPFAASFGIAHDKKHCIFNRPYWYPFPDLTDTFCLDIVSLDTKKTVKNIQLPENYRQMVDIQTTSDSNLFITTKDHLFYGGYFLQNNQEWVAPKYTDYFKSLYLIDSTTGDIVATPTISIVKKLEGIFFKKMKVCPENSCIILFAPTEKKIAYISLIEPFVLRSNTEFSFSRFLNNLLGFCCS